MPLSAADYRPRDAEHAVLYRVIAEHLEAFLETAKRHADGSPLPGFVEQEFRDFLTCGVLAHGFARLRCADCAVERLVPFSCKGRGFCPSCGGRRMTECAARLVDEVLPRVPVRQWVLSLPYRLRYLLAWDHALARAVLGVFARMLPGFQCRRARQYGPRLCRGCRLGLSRAACREWPLVAIPRETDHFHLAGGARARPFGDEPRAGILRKNGRDRVRQPQNVARVVANATRRFGRETLAPDGGVERVAELTLEGQGDASGRLFRPEPSFAKPVLGYCGFDNELHQAAAPDQRSVFLAQDREITECQLLIALENGLQKCGRLLARARPASGIKMLRDFGECVDASEERQIVRRDPAQHETSRLQPVGAVRQGHVVDGTSRIRWRKRQRWPSRSSAS